MRNGLIPAMVVLPDGRVMRFFVRGVLGIKPGKVHGRFSMDGTDSTISCQAVQFHTFLDRERAAMGDLNYNGFAYPLSIFPSPA